MTLIEAVHSGDFEKTKILLQSGADVHQSGDKTKTTALHFAVVFDHDEIGSLLMQYGADFKRCNADGESPFFMAEQMGRGEWLKKFS